MTTSTRADVIVRGGMLVTGQDITRRDVVIREGKVVELTDDPSREAGRIIDATGKYVLPGAIDSHCHPVYNDKMDDYSITAAYGGITTVIAFVGNVRSWGFEGYTADVIKQFIDEAERLSYLDYAIHGTYTPADGDSFNKSVGEIIRMGVISFKMFLAYRRRGMEIPEDNMIRIMDLASKDGGMAMVHAENGPCIDFLIDQYTAEGNTSPPYFLRSQPNILEAEGVNRSAVFSQVLDCPLYPVHLSTKEAMAVVRRYKGEGLKMFAETCPHYLTLTNDEVLTKGPIGKVGPPLREADDCEALWAALADGTIDTIASDSGGTLKRQKLTGGMDATLKDTPAGATGENIFEGRYGLNTIEFMVPVVWSYGVNRGRITLPRLVQVFCENPAKLFGLYPKKGSLNPGSDADLVVWDPGRVHVVDGQHGNTDHSAFDGFKLLGMPDLTMSRGHVVIENDEVVGTKGRGEFLPGDPNTASYARGGHQISRP